MMKKKPQLLFFLFNILTINILYSQTISPFSINNGGGSSIYMEWSLGESVSIANFIALGFSLNTGVLQPLNSVITALNNYGPTVFGTQIVIGPNPTSDLIHLKARFNQIGNLSFQLIDAKSGIIFTHEAGTIFSSFEKDILMEYYPSGIYYMRVFFKPSNGSSKIGIYKIIKL